MARRPVHIPKTALTDKKRASLRASDFAVPNERKYPINDLFHARLALTYVLTPSNAAYRDEVVRAVMARYPELQFWWASRSKGVEAKRTTRKATSRRMPGQRMVANPYEEEMDEDELERERQQREDAVLLRGLGPNVGLNADWNESAYYIAPKGGKANRTSGAIYLNNLEGGDWSLVQVIYDEEEGTSDFEPLKTFGSVQEAVNYISSHRDELEQRARQKANPRPKTTSRRMPGQRMVANPRRSTSLEGTTMLHSRWMTEGTYDGDDGGQASFTWSSMQEFYPAPTRMFVNGQEFIREEDALRSIESSLLRFGRVIVTTHENIGWFVADIRMDASSFGKGPYEAGYDEGEVERERRAFERKASGVRANPRPKTTRLRMPGQHMVANPEREDFPIDPFAMLFELERLEESAKTLSDADVRSALAESKKKLKSAADRLRRVQKGSDRRAVTEASQLRGHYAGMSFILETELAERGLRPFPRHDNPRPAKRSRYEGLDTAIMLAASSIAGNVADTRDYRAVWSSPLEAVNMSEGTAELLWREGEFGSSTGYPFEKAWPSIKRDALGMTKQIWFDVKSNPRAAKPASKRTGSRTSAQSNAAKAMKLFHSGQASSLAEAWAMLRRR